MPIADIWIIGKNAVAHGNIALISGVSVIVRTTTRVRSHTRALSVTNIRGVCRNAIAGKEISVCLLIGRQNDENAAKKYYAI